MRTLLVLFLMLSLLSVRAEEGHASWWWCCKQGDLIVRGKITYEPGRVTDEPKQFYQIVPPVGRKPNSPAYYLCATLRIEQVLYANSESQYADNFRHYLRSIGKEFEVLLPAERIHLTDSDPKVLHLDPTVSGAFFPGASIFALDVTFTSVRL